MTLIESMFFLEERILRRGYLPKRVWRLYKAVKGDPYVTVNGLISRQIRTGESITLQKRRNRVSKDGKTVYSNGWCVECGTPLPHRSFTCCECGCDNQWAIRFGLTQRSNNEE